MENPQIIDNGLSNSTNTLSLTEEAKSFLNETRKWTKFLSIIGFVFVGIFVLFGLFFGTIMGKLIPQEALAQSAFPFAFLGVFYIILALIYAIPIFYLYQFSVNLGKALNLNNDEGLTHSFSYLKSHYKFFGIFTIIIIAIYAVLLIIGVIAAAVI